MLKVKVNLGIHKLFCIKYMFVSGVQLLYLYGSSSPSYSYLYRSSTQFRNKREKIYKIVICPYGGQEKLKWGSLFLNGLFLKCKYMSLLKVFSYLGVYSKLCLRSKLI
jgi:hypothetical protein